jgi:enoyl-CoA hydratase
MGSLMLLAGDVRIGATGDFRIGLNEVAIGMGLPIFAAELARYRLTPAGFNAAVLGDVFDPDGAANVGYLDRVVAADDAVAEATKTAHRLAELRTGAVAHTKELARSAVARTILDTLQSDMASVSGPSPR